MTTRTFLAGATLALCLPLFTSAATLAELQAQLAALMAQLSALQQRNVQTQTTTQQSTQTTQASASVQCPNVTRNFFRGMRGADMTSLQTFLISQGHLEAGNNTGFYGALTEAAVKQFQCKHLQICSGSASSNGYGAVGPKTRTAIAQACRTSNTSSGASVSISNISSNYAQAGYASQSSQTSTQTDTSQSSSQSSTAQASYAQGSYGATGAQQTSTETGTQTSTSQSNTNTTASCSFSGQTIAHGQSVTAYQSSSVAAGQTCQSQIRTCNNGTLSGSESYHYSACSTESQTWTMGEPALFASRPGYDYDPTIMSEDNWMKVWWCGQNSNGHDSIYYMEKLMVSPYTVNGPQQVFNGSGVYGSFDKEHVCNPSVVKGSFSYSGHTYPYAMYYAGSRLCESSSQNCESADNYGPANPYGMSPAEIGVVFSNDGKTWVGQNASFNPLVRSSCMHLWGLSGLSAWNIDGNNRIRLFTGDACAGGAQGMGKTALFTNGTTLTGSWTQIPNAGLASNQIWHNTAFAVNSSNNLLYMTIPNKGATRELCPNNQCPIGIYTIPLIGTDPVGTWSLLTQVDYPDYSAVFKQPNAPAFMTNVWGDMNGVLGNGTSFRMVTGGSTSFGDASTADLYWMDFNLQ